MSMHPGKKEKKGVEKVKKDKRKKKLQTLPSRRAGNYPYVTLPFCTVKACTLLCCAAFVST